MQQARALQQSEAFAEYRQRRVVVEHRLARLVQLGIRQSRYFGRIKTRFQLYLAATVVNLEHIIIPVGIINEATEAETTIRLIPPHPGTDKLQPQGNILTRDSGTGAHARAVVRAVKLQENLARFHILELETEPE